MFGKFLNHFGRQKVKEAKKGVTEMIVKFDPQSASEAQISMLDEQVSELSLETSKIRQLAQKERAEATAARDNYNNHLKAAQHIENQLDDESLSKSKRAELEKSLLALTEKLEEMYPDVQTEIQEADEAEQELSDMETMLKSAADKLKSARKTHDRAMREMSKSERQVKQAAEKEARAKRLSGITADENNFDVALNAMREITENNKAQADASSRKADLLKTETLADDTNISAALASVTNTDVTSKTASERLGKLKAL